MHLIIPPISQLGLSGAFLGLAGGRGPIGDLMVSLVDPLGLALLHVAAAGFALAACAGVAWQRRLIGQPGLDLALGGLALWLMDTVAGALLLLPSVAAGVPDSAEPVWGPMRASLALAGGLLVAAGFARWTLALRAEGDEVVALRAERERLEGLVRQRHLDVRTAEEKLLSAVEQQTRAEAAAEGSLDRWRSLVENAPSVILTVDREHRIVFANRKPAGVPGRTATGASALDLVLPDDRERWRDLLQAALRAGEAGSAEFAVPGSASGEPGWQAIRVGPISRGGDIVGVTVICTDITEWKRGEEARRAGEARDRQLRHLEELSAFRAQLLEVAAEGLSNPLQPIRLQLSLLKTPGPPTPEATSAVALAPRHAQALSLIESNVQRLHVRVQDMRDLARLERQQLHLHLAPVDLQAVLATTAAAFAEPAQQAHVHLEAQIGEPLVVLADGERLLQVLFTLVGNAVKFTPAGGIVALAAGADDREAFVRVQDTGRGLSAERIRHLFQPFSQLHAPREAKEHATGLGLYLARGITEAHGGLLTVESDGPGMGSTFTLRLPLPRGQGPSGSATSSPAGARSA